jgi:integrase/recombinase XerD
MNKSDDRAIPQKSSIFPIHEKEGAENPQNPAFLNVLDPKNDPTEAQVASELQMAKIRLAHAQDLECLKLWLHGKAKKTQIDYTRIVNELLDCLGDKSLKEVSESFLQSFIDLAKHKSPHTQKQRVAVVKSLFKFAVKKKYVAANPADDLKSIEAHNKISERYLSQEEVFRMIDRTSDFRNRTVLKVLYGAGLRVSELVSLNWGSVQEREEGQGQITVVGKRNKKRTVGLSAGVFQDVLKLKPEDAFDSDPVFISRIQGRISIRQAHLIVSQAALRAGIARKVSPHWLRHSFCSHALDHGCPLHVLQQDLGHAKIGTTGAYLHARPGDFGGKYLRL